MTAWQTVKLGDVADFIRGINFKPDDVVPVGTAGSIACMRTKNVQTELDQSDVWAVAEAFVRRDDQILREGDVLVSSANSWNLVGKCCWIPKLAWRSSFGGFVSVLRPNPAKVDPRFLYRWFSSDRIQTTLRSFGQQTTNISNLNIERSRNLPFHLPPLAEQRRIADVLDRAEALRAKRRAALAQLDTLTQAIFLDMFGDPIRSPKYPSGTIRPLAQASSGKSSKGITSDTVTGIPIYGGNGVNGWATRPLYDTPVLVFGRVGQQCGVTELTNGPAWITDNAIVVSVCDESQLTVKYLLHAFRMTRFSERVKHLDLPFINQSMILDHSLCLPPLALQQEFARRVAAVEQLRSAHRASLRQLDELFASLQHRAFRGEL